MEDKYRFSTMIEIVLNKIIGAYVGWEGNGRDLLHEIRHVLFERLTEMFSRCEFRLSERSVRWLSDEYFKRVKFNGSQPVGEMVALAGEIDIKSLPGDELEIMSNLFDDTDFGDELQKERHRRG